MLLLVGFMSLVAVKLVPCLLDKAGPRMLEEQPSPMIHGLKT